MTRWEKRAEVLPDYPHLSILDVCFGLHTSMNGSTDTPYSTDKYLQHFAFLRCCLETWEPGTTQPIRFDSAVMELIRATLDESFYYFPFSREEKPK